MRLTPTANRAAKDSALTIPRLAAFGTGRPHWNTRAHVCVQTTATALSPAMNLQ